MNNGWPTIHGGNHSSVRGAPHHKWWATQAEAGRKQRTGGTTMDEIIETLDDNSASRILKTIAKAHFDPNHSEAALSSELCDALRNELGVETVSESISDGEMSRHALQLLANDQEMKDVVGTMAKGPAPVKLLDPVVGISLAAAVVFALKTTVEFKRDKDGRWSFDFKTKAVDRQLLKGFVERLLSWVPKGPFE